MRPVLDYTIEAASTGLARCRLLNPGLRFFRTHQRNRRHVRANALHLRLDHFIVDGARRGGPRYACGWISSNILAVAQSEAEGRHGTRVGVCGKHPHRKIALDGMKAEGCLIPVMILAPGEDANLVEIKRQARLG